MEEFIYLVLVIFGIFQIILLAKIWNMTNNVASMNEKFSILMDRAMGDDFRRKKVLDKAAERLRVFYRVSPSSNVEKIEKKVKEAIERETDFIDKIMDDYQVKHSYTVDMLENDLVVLFTK